MYAFLHLITTGGDISRARIVELGLLLSDGETIEEEFVSLVNPERRLPFRVISNTGISEADVEQAPRFYELAKQVVELTEDRVIVGHNVRFHYQILKDAFKSLGFDYKRKTLCAQKLSRKMLPDLEQYGLRAVCRELDLEASSVFRASGAINAVHSLFSHLKSVEGNAMAEGFRTPANKELLPHLSPDCIDALPNTTGVYYFFSPQGQIIYVGKSVNIRSRILSHLANESHSRARKMKYLIADIQYKETGSELLALLLESDEIKRLQPYFNRSQRKSEFHCGLYSSEDEDGYIRLRLGKLKEGVTPLTAFGSQREGRWFLNRLISQYGLCEKLCGLHKIRGACFQYSLNNCLGACIQEEAPEDYNARVHDALARYHYAGKDLLIVDKGRREGEKAVVWVEQGRYKGFGYSEEPICAESLPAVLKCISPYSDNRDVQQIIRGYLRHEKAEQVFLLD